MLDENELNEEVENVGIKAMYYNNIVDRYFTKYYIDQNTDKEQYVFIHTNGVIMCGLGSNNYLVKSGVKISEVKDLNKMTKVSGKRKHGAHILNEGEFILQFMMEGAEDLVSQNPNATPDRQFCFTPKIKGKLIEINSKIFSDPGIIQKSPEKFGFLCFILMNDARSVDYLRDKLEKLKNK
jgi:hypothetical protein